MTFRLLITLLIVVWYSVVGHVRSGDWLSELNLWTRAASVSPNKPRPHLNRAKALYGLGRFDEGDAEARTAAQLAIGQGQWK